MCRLSLPAMHLTKNRTANFCRNFKVCYIRSFSHIYKHSYTNKFHLKIIVTELCWFTRHMHIGTSTHSKNKSDFVYPKNAEESKGKKITQRQIHGASRSLSDAEGNTRLDMKTVLMF